MNYRSTRGQVYGLSFTDAVLMGLADDGGLLLPEEIPTFTKAEMEGLRSLSYTELAKRIIALYADDIPENALFDIIDRSYACFDHPLITPLVKRDDLFILELFHGPTLAFKDIALQFLGNLFEYFLKQQNRHMNIIGATSGDTGSAAIYGVRGKENISIFILHPWGRVSPVQEMQMTTVTDANVYNLAVEGTFDDAQAIVKEIFGDLHFKKTHALGAVNSINWARVLAQIVYYFHAWCQLPSERAEQPFQVSVPTGNFGDIFAGYIAKQMGLPIERLILATNSNNILSRFVNHGDYSSAAVHHSLSPSMDIQVASNFERYLYYLLDGQCDKVSAAMNRLKQEQQLLFNARQLKRVKSEFSAAEIDDEQTVATIRSFHQQSGYILDPHTAVGVAAGQAVRRPELPLVCLATAHPAKFPDAVIRAIGQPPVVPSALAQLDSLERRIKQIPADLSTVKTFIADHAI